MRAKTVLRTLSAVLSAAMLLTSVPSAALADFGETALSDSSEADAGENLLKLWYDEPASKGVNRTGLNNQPDGFGSTEEDRRWEQQTLPIGNSFMGANVYGEIASERLTFNQKTLWNGGPSTRRPNYNGGNKENMTSVYQSIIDAFLAGENSRAASLCNSLTGESAGYGSYQSWGDIYLTFSGLSDSTTPEEYERNLDLTEGIANVDFTTGGTDYHREYFISYPDNVLAMKLTATGDNQLNFNVRFPFDNGEQSQIENRKSNNLAKENETYNVNAETGTIVASANMQDNQMKLNSVLKVVTEGTVTVGENDSLNIANASEAVIFISADTDYKNEYPKYRTGETPVQLAASVKSVVDQAVTLGYDTVKEHHLADYQELFGRVSLDLGQSSLTESPETTDMLLTHYNGGSATAPQKRLLEVLLYQFGRYLTISSSRDGDLPSNLQGVWQNRVGDHGYVPWASDYHMNVNLQMNYWPTYSANLAECATPLIDYVDSLREPGRVTAEKYYGIKSEAGEANGFSAHTQNTPFGWTCPGWAFSWGWSPAAVPWILQNCWEYYEYTGDVEYMREKIYPMLKEEAILYDQILVDSGTKITIQNEDGTTTESTRLVSAPAYSPEWGDRTLGNAYENELIWQLYEDVITAATTLGVDQDLVEVWKAHQSRLAPVEIGDEGQIKEWYNETTLNKSDHRHMSHLLGLFPGDLISVENEDYINAAVVSLENRGYVTTGWGMGQRINAWARTGNGETSHLLIRNLFQNGIYPNLWDTHAPFQIDGNFGYTSGVNEMLMQSNMGYINILPAIPSAEWANGSVDGIVARGNFELGINWQNAKATSVKILSKNGGTCTVQCAGIKGNAVTIKDQNNKTISFTPDSEKERVTFETTKGSTYTITGFGDAIEKGEKLNAPTNVTAVGNANGVTLTWSAVTGADSYNVYRKINTDFVKINTADITGTTYTDPDGLDTEGEIKYRVAAVKDGVEGKSSNAVNADVSNVGRQVTITFESEKELGSGTLPSSVQKQNGSSYALPDCTASVTGYLFTGWSDGTRTYEIGENYTVPLRNVTLTAVWDTRIQPNRSHWQATATSQHNSGTDGPASSAIDGNEGTWWHSAYNDDNGRIQPTIGDPGTANEITIDFGKTVDIDSFEYVPRSEGKVNGNITGYKLLYSTEASGDDNFILIDSGTWAYDASKKKVVFDNTISMRRIQLRATQTNEGANRFIHAAELNAYRECKDTIVAVTGITADSEMTLKMGETKKLSVTTIPENATYKEFTYASSNSQIASVSADGTVTAGTKAGEATITITANGGAETTCKVTVTYANAVERISLEKVRLVLKPNDSSPIAMNIEPYYGTDKTVTWASSDPEVAKFEDGKIKAKKLGNATITVTSTASGLTASCVVWVVEDPTASADKTELSGKITECETEYTDLSVYTEESLQAYQAALAYAKKVAEVYKNAVPDEVTEALQNLQYAAGKLETKPTGGLPKPPSEEEKKLLAVNDTFEEGDFSYRITKAEGENGEVILLKPTAAASAKGTINIPDTVQKGTQIFQITAIDASAFSGNLKLKTLTIGSNVTSIGQKSFFKCKKLKSITFKGVKAPAIGKQAFKQTKSKCKVFYPKKMKSKEVKKLKKNLKRAGAKVGSYKKKK